MTVRYLLDANIISDLVHNPAGRATAKIEEIGDHSIATSVIVAAELRYGATKKKSARLTARVDNVLNSMRVLPFDAPADRRYAEARVELEAAGKPIGANDLLIAAQALAHDMILVTDNEREFRRVAGLRVENWLKD